MDSLITEVPGRAKIKGGETRKMKRRIIAGMLLIALVAVSVGVAAEAESINIIVAPPTLNLESHGNGVTVHADIAFCELNCSTVTLEVEGTDITIRSCYSDCTYSSFGSCCVLNLTL